MTGQFLKNVFSMVVLRSCFVLIIFVILDLFEQSQGGVVTSNTTSSNGPNHTTHRRFQALWELGSMVKCTTGKRLFRAIFDYAWYGCYCGFGGKGVPVDGTDRCCMIHDDCYDMAFKSGECPCQPEVYVVPYKRRFHMKNCLTPEANITCDTASTYPWWFPRSRCAAAICKCDAAVAMCLGNNRFNPNHALYPKRTCRKGIAPTVGLPLASEVTTW